MRRINEETNPKHQPDPQILVLSGEYCCQVVNCYFVLVTTKMHQNVGQEVQESSDFTAQSKRPLYFNVNTTH